MNKKNKIIEEDSDDEGLSYAFTKGFFQERIANSGIQTGDVADATYLYEFPYYHRYTERQRLNIILPLIVWCVEHNTLTDNLSGELDYYYDELINGRLDDFLDPKEAEEIIHDITSCYKKVFES